LPIIRGCGCQIEPGRSDLDVSVHNLWKFVETVLS